mmetsp:Transcript_4786/g.14943  ORF Transcript_4786/g.14943 Transcript_4786/m.14943 type:complete len:272 (+) Transcript_4786:704-1519(+)
MLRRDARADVRRAVADEVRRLFRRAVFQDDLQIRPRRDQRLEDGFEERPLPVEDVDVARRLAVDEEQQALGLHLVQDAVNIFDVGHAAVRIRRGALGVELARDHDPAFLGGDDFLARRVVLEIQRHERFERRALGPSGEEALAVRDGERRGRHRRLQVGHGDGAAERPSRERHRRAQRVAVAEVVVPVVGPRDFEVLDRLLLAAARGAHLVAGAAAHGSNPATAGVGSFEPETATGVGAVSRGVSRSASAMRVARDELRARARFALAALKG